MVLKLTFKNLWRNVWFANKIYYNHFPFQAKGGQMSWWILSQVYQSLKERVSSWWLLIDLLNMHTSLHYLTPSKQAWLPIQKIHGTPNIIVHDRDPIFNGIFWTKLFSCLGTQLAHSSSYHPQFDGQREIVKNVWKGIFHDLQLINKHNGSSGYPWQNGGIILPSIHHKKWPHLWHCMATIHHPSHLH